MAGRLKNAKLVYILSWFHHRVCDQLGTGETGSLLARVSVPNSEFGLSKLIGNVYRILGTAPTQKHALVLQLVC